MEGPPVRGPAGPRSPCFHPPLPRDRGEVYVLCGGGVRGVEGAGTMYGLSPGARPCVPCARGRAARPAGGFRRGPGLWVAAGGRGGCGARGGRGAVWADQPAAGDGPESPTPWGQRAPGARAPRRLGRGGRVCKGVDAPDAGPTAGRGTSGKLEAWPGGRGLGRARGWRLAAEAEAAPCGRGAPGGRGAARADRPGVGGGPESPTPWGQRARRGHARRAVQAAGGACARAPLWAAGPAARERRGAAQGQRMGPRRGIAAWGRAGA